jgi:hypothetical protein
MEDPSARDVSRLVSVLLIGIESTPQADTGWFKTDRRFDEVSASDRTPPEWIRRRNVVAGL